MAATARPEIVDRALQEASDFQRFVTCKQASEILKISEVSVRRFLTQKKLRRYKVGSRTLLELSQVLGLIRESES